MSVAECPIHVEARCIENHVHSKKYAEWLKLLIEEKATGIEIVLLPEEKQ